MMLPEGHAFWAPVCESILRDDDAQRFIYRPQTFIETPMRVRRQRETVTWIIVSRCREGLHVRCLDDCRTRIRGR